MRRLAAALLLVLLTIGPALTADWFPLEVGNRWSYRCVHTVRGSCGVEGQGCFCREGDLLELSVIDTARIDVSLTPGLTGLEDADPPRSAAGTLYYVLGGSKVSYLAPEGYPRNDDGALLVRQVSGVTGTDVVPPSRGPNQPLLEQALLLGGWRLTSGWELFGQAELLFDFAPGDVWSCDTSRSFASALMWGVRDYRGVYPAGTLSPLSFVEIEPGCICDGWQLVFAPGVGLAALAVQGAGDFYSSDADYYVLTEAVVSGVRYPGSSEIGSRTWGQAKTEGR